MRAAWRTGILVAVVLAGCFTVPMPLASQDTSGSPAPPAPARGTSVPVQILGNSILVPVVVNGAERVWFLLDTGANVTVIAPALLRRLGVEVPGDAPKMRARIAGGQLVDIPVMRIASIAVGNARILNLPVAIYDVSKSVNMGGSTISIDGFLGYDFLGRFMITLSRREATLTLQADDPLPR